MYTHIHIYIDTYIHIYVYIHTYAYMHAYVHTYVHAYTLTFMHSYIHAYIHIYIFIYIYRERERDARTTKANELQLRNKKQNNNSNPRTTAHVDLIILIFISESGSVEPIFQPKFEHSADHAYMWTYALRLFINWQIRRTKNTFLLSNLGRANTLQYVPYIDHYPSFAHLTLHDS